MRKKIVENPDQNVVKDIREGLAAKEGHCPCMVGKTADNKCMCKEFREGWRDMKHGDTCHCGLYMVEEVEDKD